MAFVYSAPQAPVLDIVYASSGNTGVASGGTITFQYPDQRAASSYAGQWPARMNIRAMQANYVETTDFAIAYGATSIVVTYNAASSIPKDVTIGLQLPLAGFSTDTSDTAYPALGQVLPANNPPQGQ